MSEDDINLQAKGVCMLCVVFPFKFHCLTLAHMQVVPSKGRHGS